MLPKLRRFGIWADEVEEGVLVNTLRSVVNASNQLEEIEIHSEIDRTNYDEVFHLITQILSLRSVTLDQSVLSAAAGDDGEELEWDAFASLLRRCSDPEWMDFFDDPEPHPFRQFFYRHPRIEDLALGYVHESGYWKDIDPTELPPLFPSLKYFEGPAFLFKPLVLSSLAEQIEKLIVVDNRLYRDSLIELGDRTTMLPKLRKFGIWATEVEEGVLVNTLRSVVNASNQLEDIEIHPEIDSTNYEEVFSLITQVPSLRSVTLDQSVLSAAAADDGEELEWDAFASLLRRTCPALQSIYQSIEKRDKENRKKVWELHDNV
ncbi:hypothetical protein RSOLAG22IIIB_08325 [Rhizoctonia solani]|uniref:Uncharacterized protein n=1 Tax=Rhizoctonia solani TaxID=456999 RepID=A0A0K6FT59_9AGAM|nr:hypothetical protein RSOLAG22IIIB_08325 [Rhizoctonia solani]